MIQDSLLSFLSNWHLDKEMAQEVLRQNRKYNADLKSGRIPGKIYPEDRETFSLYNLKSAEVINQTLPGLLHKKCGIPKSKFKIQGSIGQGNPAEIPWICVFDIDISISAQEGFYIVYLFKSDMSGLYLSLNQGWTQYHRVYGTKDGREEIKRNASLCKKLLKSDQGFSYESINLLATKALGKGYEAGNICSKYYKADEIPDEEELINDLRNLIGVYRELKGLVGSDILDVKSLTDEETFQLEIQKGTRKILQEGAVKRKEKKQVASSISWSRDYNIAFTALDNAQFQCENDSSHKTFTSAKTGKQFVEAHHLIPMEFQGEFEVSIDVPENIISLCPNCHRAFHNAEESTKNKLITKFYTSRFDALGSRSLNLSLQEILNFYNS